MLVDFKKNENYYSACVLYLFNIILNMPQFNNDDDVAEISDIYIRKMVSKNSFHSNKAYCDVYDLIHMFYEPDYINAVIRSFDGNEVNAYHYLAIIFQKWRLENKFKLREYALNGSKYSMYLLYQAVSELSN